MGVLMRSSGVSKKLNETTRLVVTTFFGVAIGFLIGVSCQPFSLTRPSLQFSIAPTGGSAFIDEKRSGVSTMRNDDTGSTQAPNLNDKSKPQAPDMNDTSKIWVPSNPRGAERLPPGIVAAESDFYLRRLWGLPKDDLTSKPKYLVTFTVGYEQKKNIDAAVKKFSENFTILLFHYDGRTNEWDEFEWSKRAIHVSARKQTKWWYAKRFLHPDIVAPYDYIFIWDEDLGLKHFNAEEYIRLVKKYGLEISQPALDPNRWFTWAMTKRRSDHEVHKESGEKKRWCSGTQQPPCAAFVEIMAPVFSRDAWRCVWHMIQNDLVHGWGLDFALERCVQPAHEKIGVVDAQWIVHQSVPTLGNQGVADNGKAPWQGVKERCRREWKMFQKQFEKADQEYFKSLAANHSEYTTH